jgi:hypothetical protein
VMISNAHLSIANVCTSKRLVIQSSAQPNIIIQSWLIGPTSLALRWLVATQTLAAAATFALLSSLRRHRSWPPAQPEKPTRRAVTVASLIRVTRWSGDRFGMWVVVRSRWRWLHSDRADPIEDQQ